MANITLDHVSKVYPNGVTAVSDLSLTVADGELMVLVGPSGSGKTTALRMVAGLEGITDGTISIGDRVVNGLSPRDRDLAMVFQNYALYPHMTVADNIAFALKLRKLPRQEIRRRVEAAAHVLGLTEHLDRKPAQLSGGQRQRVAMGRAIVREPSAFLMDEPLSNLDAKLRVQMRGEISRVQRRLGVATLYVTHDQTEAMTMGDRVSVLRAGTLQQVDAPQVLYDAPVNTFVATFIGSPSMNLYAATLSDDARCATLGSQTVEVPERTAADPAVAGYRGSPVVVGIRPEHLTDAALNGGGTAGRTLSGDVELVEALGSEKLVHFQIDAERVRDPGALAGAAADEDPDYLGRGEIGAAAVAAGVARVAPDSAIRAGERASFAVDVDRMLLFDPAGGGRIGG